MDNLKTDISHQVSSDNLNSLDDKRDEDHQAENNGDGNDQDGIRIQI